MVKIPWKSYLSLDPFPHEIYWFVAMATSPSHTQKLLHPKRQTLTTREEGEAECWKESFVRNAAHTQPPHTRQCHIFTSHVSRQSTNNVNWYRSGIYLTQMLIDLAYLIRCRCEERHWFRVISRFLYKLFIADVVMCRWIIYWFGMCKGVQCLSTSSRMNEMRN